MREKSATDGKTYTVQYFERAVFEMHPENAPPYDVLLSLLGSMEYNARYSQRQPGLTGTPTPVSKESGGDWPMYGHDPQHRSYNPDEVLISSRNVGQLVPQWQAFLGSNGIPSPSTPAVANGRVYVGSSAASGSNFYAFEATTGSLVWSTNVGYPASCEGVGIGSSPAVSGTVVAVGGGDAAYSGLDAATGAGLWRDTLDVDSSGFAWTSPLFSRGRVYFGVASDCDNPSVRGEVRSVSMDDGHLLARQNIVPDGQAGGGIWNSPALSPDENVLAVATGEDYNGYNGPYNRAMLTLDPLEPDHIKEQRAGADEPGPGLWIVTCDLP